MAPDPVAVTTLNNPFWYQPIQTGTSVPTTFKESSGFAMQTATATAQTFTVTARGESITFSSDLSDQQVWEILSTLRASFARSLASKWPNLSPAQYAWAHKLAVDSDTKPVQDSGKQYSFQNLFNVFRNVKKGRKSLILRLEGFNLKLSRDGQSLWVNDPETMVEGNYGLQPKYLGKVTENHVDSRLSDDIKEAILNLSNDPLSAMVRYGKVSGRCSCCGLTLTDPVSVAAGIGPICKEKWGL